jgi:DNA transformation protein
VSRPKRADALEDLRNLGPVASGLLREVGITTPAELRRVGASMAYVILRHRFPKQVNLLFLYAMEGALTDRHYNSFSATEKAALKASVAESLTVGGA